MLAKQPVWPLFACWKYLLTSTALLQKRRGKKRATVALARRIGVVLHRMWRDGTEFRFTRAEAVTAAA